MIPPRWPLHPQPLPGEALSSWLERTASLYKLPLSTLVEHNLGTAARQVGKVKPSQERELLDTDPPAHLLQALHERSGVPIGQLRHMTIAGWTPWLLDTLDVEQAGTFDCFVRQDSVLFDHTMIAHGTDPGRWRPWLQSADGAERRRRACPLCAERPGHGLLLMAQLPIMLSCPEHGCLLQPAGLAVRHYPGAPDPEVTAVTEMVQDMDRRTHEGITTGQVTLPRRTVHVGVWFRLLRIVLDEVNTPMSFLRRKADKATLETIWARVERPVRAGQIRWAPYEAWIGTVRWRCSKPPPWRCTSAARASSGLGGRSDRCSRGSRTGPSGATPIPPSRGRTRSGTSTTGFSPSLTTVTPLASCSSSSARWTAPPPKGTNGRARV
ncbi:hypothetical protein Q0Z83_031830 [Actinoplanes sichuanensis]|uniref:TniQ family protein n=1 Tax=Actinoplanes sichuanensis TaxID=512349 RepID=A0ABW4AQ71_9ACTN|nr:TniQ family protein [Actinoplanes sichuanensis]BEL04992.1 hypothetical protein Q0Z83_031830 [Actinoplanes sichuanensis]